MTKIIKNKNKKINNKKNKEIIKEIYGNKDNFKK